ncbi:uncharacterized protein EDB91DRAFT_1224901 [Suillus paluster]|uniref:uncharacterized protein n=1 Tax=Suillus paluster TaxID=48578 RepID=UPI001B8626B8|nr:uncharacterized protein EDB91DRAFT_1224901 [Suillus paluster]KAG1736154.1 hypothetical protein EDB91DRAFT_1224901 [Suillus paluster]
MLDPSGVRQCGKDDFQLSSCNVGDKKIKKGKCPPLSLANRTFLGYVPDELKDLTVIEEAMIARSRAKCWIVQLKEENQDLQLPTSQRGIKGHIIIYPQRPEGIANVLPPTVADIVTPICVIFVGSCPPTRAWLEEKAKPLIARREKVRAALVWLKKHNRLYKDITIDFDVLNSMEEKTLLPFHVDHVLPSEAHDSLTSKYDATEAVQSEDPSDLSDPPAPSDDQLRAAELQANFESVVVTDVDGNASANELRAAATRHIKNKGGGYIQVPHDPEPVNEFFKPDLF